MPGVFLSHSSADKALVARLASDLVARGIPVWFDSWTLETGDSLYSRIFDGIDQSTFLLIALSPSSVASKWVNRELAAALALEDRLGRKVILPIKIGDCEVPLSIADRLYADVSRGYLQAVDKLTEQLCAEGADTIQIPFDHELVPLRFSRGIYLDDVSLQERFERLVPGLRSGQRLDPSQLVLTPDILFDDLRTMFLQIVEQYDVRPDYSPDIARKLRELYSSHRRIEAGFMSGIVELAHGMMRMNEWAFFGLAAHWFSCLMRTELAGRYLAVWPLSGRENRTDADHIVRSPMSRHEHAAKLFGVSEVFPCDIFRRESRDYIRVWVDTGSEAGIWFRENPQRPLPVKDLCTPTFMYQYVVPQMVARKCCFSPTTPLVWDWKDWYVGAA